MPRSSRDSVERRELACLAQQGLRRVLSSWCEDSDPGAAFPAAPGRYCRYRGLVAGDVRSRYTNLHRYQPRWRFATWLFTIARRLSINAHRGATGRRRDGLDLGVSPTPALRNSRQRKTADASGAWQPVLSEEEMTALWLYYVKTCRCAVAAVVERSWVAAKTMLFRARRKLLPCSPPCPRRHPGCPTGSDRIKATPEAWR